MESARDDDYSRPRYTDNSTASVRAPYSPFSAAAAAAARHFQYSSLPNACPLPQEAEATVLVHAESSWADAYFYVVPPPPPMAPAQQQQ